MSKIPDRVYWDANAWIAYIRKEMPESDPRIKHPRYEMCKGVLLRAKDKQIEIVTSSFTLAEVCKKRKEAPNPAANIPAFFEHDYIFLVDVTKHVGSRAQHLQLSGVAGLKPADSIHVASAMIANVPVLHTFDEGLCKLDRVLSCDDGRALRIVMPGRELPEPALLQQMRGE